VSNFEEWINTSYDAELIGGRVGSVADELKKLRLAVERGVGLMEQIVTRSTTGTAGTSPQS